MLSAVQTAISRYGAKQVTMVGHSLGECLLRARAPDARLHVLLEDVEGVPRGGEELRERLARLEGVLAREERDADAGHLQVRP